MSTSTPLEDDVVYIKTVKSPNAVTTSFSDSDDEEEKCLRQDEVIFLKTVKKELDYNSDKSVMSDVKKEKTTKITSVKDVFGPHDRDTCLMAITIAIDNLEQEKKLKTHWTKDDEKWNIINKRNLRIAKQYLLSNSVSGQSIVCLTNIKGIGPFLAERIHDLIKNLG